MPINQRGSSWIGYQSKPAAMYNLVRNFSIASTEREDFFSEVQAYLVGIRDQVITTGIPEGRVTQCGTYRELQYTNDKYHTVIRVQDNGSISLSPLTTIAEHE